MPQTYPQRIFKCKQLSIVGLKVKCATEQAQAATKQAQRVSSLRLLRSTLNFKTEVQHGQINHWL